MGRPFTLSALLRGLVISFGTSAFAFANSVVLTPAQQVELMESVRTLQRELKDLRSEFRTFRADSLAKDKQSKLKTEDYGNRVPGSTNTNTETGGAGLSGAGGWMKGAVKGLMDQVNQAKEKQQKHNDELNKLEKELP